MATQDKDELAGLSEQERAALAEDTEDETTLKAIVAKAAPDAGDAADEDEDDAAAGADAADPAAAAAATAAAQPDAAAAAATQAAAKPAEAASAKPAEAAPVVFTASAPEDAAEQITALRGEKAVLFKQLMDGELTPEEYSAKEDEIMGKITVLDRTVTTATVAAEFTVQQAQRSYLGKVNATLDAAKAEGIDYRAPENKHLHEDLDRTVKFLANDPSNADKPEQWFLDKAHSMVKAMHGLGANVAAVADAVTGKKTGGKAPDLTGLPPSLRTVPNAADSDDGGEFAHLSALNGMQLERALSKLSPEQQQRYLEA